MLRLKNAQKPFVYHVFRRLTFINKSPKKLPKIPDSESGGAGLRVPSVRTQIPDFSDSGIPPKTLGLHHAHLAVRNSITALMSWRVGRMEG